MADNLPAMNSFRKMGDKYTYNGIEMTKEEFDQKKAEVDQAMQKMAPKVGRSPKDRAADAFKDLEGASPVGNKKGGKIMKKADGGEVKAQEALNKAYFAMTSSPKDKKLADAYSDARDALHSALESQRTSNKVKPKNPNEGAPFTIFNHRTGEKVGKANTLKGARRSKDRKDNEYGGYAHAIKDSEGNSRHKSGGKVKTAQQNPKHKNCW